MQNQSSNNESITTSFFQKWTATGVWAGRDEETGLSFGLTPLFWKAGERPEDEIVRKIFWGDWCIREMYELAETEYFLFLCEDLKEAYSLMKECKNGLKGAPDGRIWWPCWASIGDKGNHVVFLPDKHYPEWWMKKLGLLAILNGRGDRFWKAMKRFRRTTAHPEVFGQMRVITNPVRDWNGRKGWTMYTLFSPDTLKDFTVLVRPMLKNADGQSFATVDGIKKAWGIETRPLDMFSLGGVCDMGAIKGHCLVTTPGKEMPADFVITDPKDEMVLTDQRYFYLNVQFHCHRYNFARTDTQSILHYGLERFLKPAAEMYLEDLKAMLMDTDRCMSAIGDVERDEDGEPVEDMKWSLQKIVEFCNTTQKFAFNKIPYVFRALVNQKLKGLRDLYAGNDRNSVRIPLPKDLFTRRYLAVWEDVIDETGMETDPSTHLIKAGECMMHEFRGDVTTWRQPNGYWRFNILKSIDTFLFAAIYGDKFNDWLAKSPCMFVTADPNAQPEMMENWDGADFDDNVIVGRGVVVDHFKSLLNTPFPPARPRNERPQMHSLDISNGFDWTWKYVMAFMYEGKKAKGIGTYCNRWMTYNYFLRLAKTNPEKYGHLMAGVEAPMHILGNESEVIIDSHAKFGGTGLEVYDRIIEQYEKEIPYLSPFFIWKDSTGWLKSRMGIKVAGRLMQAGRASEITPIDEAVDEIKPMVEAFDRWASETYKNLPASWGTDPVFMALDSYQPLELAPKADWVREEYAKYFGVRIRDKKLRKSQIEAANNWAKGIFGRATYRGICGVLSLLFQHVYNTPARPDESGMYRFCCEDLLWEVGIDHMLGDAIPFVLSEKAAKASFPLEHRFNIKFNIRQKLESGEITQEQANKWVALGMKGFRGYLKPGDLGMDLFVNFGGQERLMGHATDRNAYRAFLLNASEPLEVRLASSVLMDGSVSANVLCADVKLAELRPTPSSSVSKPKELIRYERLINWRLIDQRMSGDLVAR